MINKVMGPKKTINLRNFASSLEKNFGKEDAADTVRGSFGILDQTNKIR